MGLRPNALVLNPKKSGEIRGLRCFPKFCLELGLPLDSEIKRAVTGVPSRSSGATGLLAAAYVEVFKQPKSSTKRVAH